MANETQRLQAENIAMRRDIDDYRAKDKEFSELTEEEFKELVQRNPRVKSLYDKSVAKGAHSTAENRLQKMKEEQQAPDPTPEIDARADRLDRKERALALAIEKNLEPAQAFALLGLDADSTDEPGWTPLRRSDKRAEMSFSRQTGARRTFRSICRLLVWRSWSACPILCSTKYPARYSTGRTPK